MVLDWPKCLFIFFCKRFQQRLLGGAQLCPALCSPMDCSLPGSSAHGIFQIRILEQGAISYSRGSSQPKDRTHALGCPALAGRFLTTRATWAASQQRLVVFNFIRNHFVRMYCDSSHISLHEKKKKSELVNFCVAVLIQKMEERKQHFWHIMLYYLKRGKNATEMQKKICAVYGEGAVID